MKTRLRGARRQVLESFWAGCATYCKPTKLLADGLPIRPLPVTSEVAGSGPVVPPLLSFNSDEPCESRLVFAGATRPVLQLDATVFFPTVDQPVILCTWQ